MEALNKQQMLIFWHWLMLSFCVASMQMIATGKDCCTASINCTLDYSGSKLMTLPITRCINLSLTFNFSENALQRFPGGTVRFKSPRLETLDLSHNQIEEFDPMAFGFVPSLIHLIVSHNKLSSIRSGSFINLTNLKFLDISFNNLPDLPKGLWEGLIEVKKLLLSRNSLTTLQAGAFDFLKQLEYLDLSRNAISVINMNAFTDLSLLQHLKLYHNNLSEVPHIPDSFRQDLQTLNLSGNPIKTLRPNDFGRLVYLHHLDLSKMHLDYVDPTTFKDLQALNELYLDTNRLQTLQVEAIHSLHRLNSLSLFNNFWVCNCSLSELVEYLLSNIGSNINVTHINSTFCISSDSRRVPLRGLENSKMCMFPYSEVLSAVFVPIVLIIIIATLMFCVYRQKRLKMQDESTSLGIIPPGISRQTSSVMSTSVRSSVTMSYFEFNVPGSSGANSGQSGDETAGFTTLDHLYSSIKSATPVYSYADSRDLLPVATYANTIKSPPERSPPKRYATCPLKPGKDKVEAKDEGLYLKPIKVSGEDDESYLEPLQNNSH